MVRTKADGVPGSYRKVVASRAPRKVLGSSTSATNSTPLSSRKAENKYAGGNPVCVRPTPKWQKELENSSGCPLKIQKKRIEFLRRQEAVAWEKQRENKKIQTRSFLNYAIFLLCHSQISSINERACPLPPDHTDDEKE